MMRKITFLLASLLLATSAMAEEAVVGYLAVRYDLDVATATNAVACISEGVHGPWDGQGRRSYRDQLVDNAGSGTTIDLATTGETPFLGMAVGDVMFINVSGTIYPRTILTYTSSSSVVVDEAIDLSAADYSFTWRDQTCGKTASDGWINVASLSDVTLAFFLKQYGGDGNGLDIRVEGTIKTPDGTTNIVQLYPTDKTVGGAATWQNFTTAGIASNLMVTIPEVIDSVRVLMCHNTADDATPDTTSEQITIVVLGRRSS